MKRILTTILLILLSITLSAQSLNWQKASPDYIINASAGNGYMIMTNSRPASLKLPQNPSDGDVVGFMDVSGTFGINSLTVDPGNIPIDGNRGIKVFTSPDISMTLVYSSSPYGWKTLTTNAGSGGNPLLENVSAADTLRWGVLNVTPVTQFGAVGDGITDNTSAFNTALAAVDEIFIPNGTFKISGTVSIPAGKNLVFANSGKIDVAGTLIGNHTSISAGMYQIFTLVSDIQGTWDNETAFVEWFGAKGDGTGTIDAAAIQKTLEVFCKVNSVGSDMYDIAYGVGTTVIGTGWAYNIEQTIEFPAWGRLEFSETTLLLGGTNNFFDSYVNITELPFNIKGGKWIVRRYDDQAGWAGSAQDSAAKYQYAYNQNPVFRVYSRTQLQSSDLLDERNVRFLSSFKDIEIKMAKGYPRWVSESYYLKYDGFVITGDTSVQSSGTLDLRRNYYIKDYHAGDDFTNVGAASNATGISFNATGTTPAVWTNGSVIQNKSNAIYQCKILNVEVKGGDTALYMQGAAHGEMVNSWIINGFHSTSNNCAIALGDRTAGHLISNLTLQSPTEDFQKTPLLDIGGSMNNITGVIWDSRNDSAVTIRSGTAGNVINLTAENNRFVEQSVKFERKSGISTNDIGSHSMWHICDDPPEGDREMFWFKGVKTGFKGKNVITIDKNINPRTVVDIIGNPGYAPLPTQILESQSNGYEADNDIDATNGFANTLSLVTRVSTGQVQVRPGLGPSIRFFVADTCWNTPDDCDYDQYALGMMGFRQDGYMNTVGEKGVFQMWQNDNGSWINTMTIDEQGDMGMLGVFEPAYTIDLVGTASTTVSGVAQEGTLRTANILDDGSGIVDITAVTAGEVTINDVLNLTPRATAPASPTEGTIYSNSSDNHIYIYLNSTWKQLDN